MSASPVCEIVVWQYQEHLTEAVQSSGVFMSGHLLPDFVYISPVRTLVTSAE